MEPKSFGEAAFPIRMQTNRVLFIFSKAFANIHGTIISILIIFMKDNKTLEFLKFSWQKFSSEGLGPKLGVEKCCVEVFQFQSNQPAGNNNYVATTKVFRILAI